MEDEPEGEGWTVRRLPSAEPMMAEEGGREDMQVIPAGDLRRGRGGGEWLVEVLGEERWERVPSE